MKLLSRRAACAFLLACALAASVASRAQDPRTTAIQGLARDWLAIVDRGDYAASWNAAAAKFKLAMTPERWNEAAKAVREPLGKVDARTLVRTSFTKSFPGAPEGEYALVVFRTAFQNKPQSEETITLEQEADQQWRVVGYTVR